jgi:hypothetical protein
LFTKSNKFVKFPSRGAGLPSGSAAIYSLVLNIAYGHHDTYQ